MNAKDTIILLAGKSGSGKSTVANYLAKNYGMPVLQSYTTRARRKPGETGHIFITDAEFDRIRPDEMVAYTEFDGHRYCATTGQVDEAGVYVIDKRGIEEFKEKYHGKKRVVVAYLTVNNDTLRKRMKHRGDTDEMIESRIRNDAVMFDGIEKLSDIIIDAKLPVEQTAAIIMNPESKGFYTTL